MHHKQVGSITIFLKLTCSAWITISIIIIIKNEKIRVTLCENAAGALYIINKMCVDGRRNVQGWNRLMIISIVTRAEEECLQFLTKRR